MVLQDADAAADRVDAPQPGRLDAAFHVRVEEPGHRAEFGPGLHGALWRSSRIATRFDLSDEEPLPISRFLDRFDRTLSTPPVASSRVLVHIDRRILGLT